MSYSLISDLPKRDVRNVSQRSELKDFSRLSFVRKPVVNRNSTRRMAIRPFGEHRDDELNRRPLFQISMAPRTGVIGRRPLPGRPITSVPSENGVTLVASTLRRTSGGIPRSFVLRTVPRLMHVENGHHFAGPARNARKIPTARPVSSHPDGREPKLRGGGIALVPEITRLIPHPPNSISMRGRSGLNR